MEDANSVRQLRQARSRSIRNVPSESFNFFKRCKEGLGFSKPEAITSTTRIAEQGQLDEVFGELFFLA